MGSTSPPEINCVDHHTLADHLVPCCRSHEFYHGILAGKATGRVQSARVFVHPDAAENRRQADQPQTSSCPPRRLFIPSRSWRFSPDDVKCTHGATVGQLDDEAPLLSALARGWARNRHGRCSSCLLPRRAGSCHNRSRAQCSRPPAVRSSGKEGQASRLPHWRPRPHKAGFRLSPPLPTLARLTYV